MKTLYLLAAGGFSVCGFLATPALAQGASMPADHSTPAEQAETARLNRQISQSNAEISAQDNSNHAKYQIQKEQYRGALRKNHAAQQDYQTRKAAYEEQRAHYETLRDHYRAERANYRRHDWPSRYADWRLKSDASVMQARVQLINGDYVGTVIGVARTPDEAIEGLEIGLDSGKQVWINAADARFDSANGQIITDLHASDVRRMVDKRFG